MMHPYVDITLRSIAVYLFMLAALRVFGKKELAQLNPTDIILILLISNAVQNAMVGPDTTLTGGIIAATALFAVNFILKKMIRTKWLGNLFIDKAELLIHNGKLDFKKLAQLDISNDELKEAIREHGVEHFSDVKIAILEPDGNISVISGDVRLQQTHYKRAKVKKQSVRGQ